MIFKKLKDGVIKKNSAEYDRMIESLCKISSLTFDETELCIEQSKKNFMRDKF